MNRAEELKLIKELIEEYYDQAKCGLFDCRNMVGDAMENLYEGEYFDLDICYGYMYFEVFGTTEDEFCDLLNFYESLNQ